MQLIRGDCLEVMATFEANSIDAIVTDPPYGLSFMGKNWDHGIPGVPFWAEALRVAKPGCHLLAFGGTRTFHRLACAIEDAGWEIRDTLMWVYGSGFPKSLDVSKAIDKAAGVQRKVVGIKDGAYLLKSNAFADKAINGHNPNVEVTAPATDAARQWEGWGTALKPAYEPIILARKPLDGTVAANVQKWGCGAINVDGCRVEGVPPSVPQPSFNSPTGAVYGFKCGEGRSGVMSQASKGRWPANLLHDGSEEVLELFPESAGGAAQIKRRSGMGYHGGARGDVHEERINYPKGSGSAARFFYCAKASRAERTCGGAIVNGHPTIKPLALMRYLCRLITPPNGVILDPFMGSGTTGMAAKQGGFEFIGIEKEAEYIAIAEARIGAALEARLKDRPA